MMAKCTSGLVLAASRMAPAMAKADTPDGLGVGVDSLVQVGGVVGLLLGLGVTDLDTGLLVELLQALPGKLVEGAVVHAAHVGDHLDLVVGLGGRGAGLGAGGLGVATAAGNGQRDGAGQGKTHETILLHALPFLRFRNIPIRRGRGLSSFTDA